MRPALALVLSVALVAALGASRIEEDSPHWDCAAMGNLVCGVDS